MFNRLQKRLQIATYSILALLSVLLFFISYARDSEGFLGNALLNLATELIGVVIVFAIVDRIFLREEYSLFDKVSQLIDRLKNGPKASEYFKEEISLSKLMEQAKKIDLCGVTLTSTINNHLFTLRDQLKNGTHIRVLIIDSESLAPKIATKRSANTEDFTYYMKRVDTTLGDLIYLYEELERCRINKSYPSNLGTLSVRLISYPPSFSILSFDSDRPNGTVISEIYPHHQGFDKPPLLCMSANNDKHWHHFYTQQFEEIWGNGKVWLPNT